MHTIKSKDSISSAYFDYGVNAHYAHSPQHKIGIASLSDDLTVFRLHCVVIISACFVCKTAARQISGQDIGF